ncbi:MAG: hypothetical protein O7G85_09730 [Planctomycetota bacterium]|nr:hypothetical protein [Planctomycetota bacterium]
MTDRERLIRNLERRTTGRDLENGLRRCHQELDGKLLGALLKGLVKSGLPHVGASFLRSLPDLKTRQPAFYSLIDKLEALLPGATIGEAVLKTSQVLTTLLESRVHLMPLTNQIEASGRRVEIFRTEQGHCVAMKLDEGGGFIPALPEIAGPADLQTLINDDGCNTMSFLLLGVPRDDVWNTLVEWRAESGFAPPIDLIEPDIDVLGVWLRRIVDPVIFEGPRIGVYAGPDAIEQYEQRLIDNPSQMLPTQIAANGREYPPLPEPPREMLKRIGESRKAMAQESIVRQRERYEGETSESWALRYQKAGVVEPALQILGLTTRHSSVMQYAMRDLKSAFDRAGCSFDLVMEPHEHTSMVAVASSLAHRDYDMVVVINHLRNELDGEVHPNLPYVCWIQDHMPRLWSRESGRSVTQLDLVLGQSRELMSRQFEYPSERYLETSNLTDPDTYCAEPLDATELDAYRCDVSYVSHGSATPEALLIDLTRGWIPEHATCLELMLERMKVALDTKPYIRSIDLAAMLQEAEGDAKCEDVSREIRLAVLLQNSLVLYDRLLRHQTLQWASAWAESKNRSLNLYGKGWDTHPSLARHARGEIENGRPLRAVYQASAINLQVNGYGSLHQRLLDGLASGGFMLTRFNPADVLRIQYSKLRDQLYRDRLDLNGIMERRGHDHELDSTLNSIERLEGLRLASMIDPIRKRQMHLQELTFNLPRHDNDDEALMRRLCTLEHLPRRVAGDLPGYEQTSFRTESEMHERLDLFVDDPEARAELSGPMRASVIEHDTYDALVRSILSHFRGLDDDVHRFKPDRGIELHDTRLFESGLNF